MQELKTLQSLVAAPFVTCSFGGETFGLSNRMNPITGVRDINYITSLVVDKKASGTVNTYQLSMTYTIEPGSDPNYIDYIISKSLDRKIVFTYGDMSQPEYSYVKEQAIITNIVPTVSISSNSIQYTISATSSVALSYAISRPFQKRSNVKPSDLILEVLYANNSGLLKLFTGMRDKQQVLAKGWIARNDIPVHIEAILDKSPLEYIRILVSKMRAADGSFFAMIIHDEPDNTDGPYFEIVNSNLYQGQGNTYSLDIDVGYPGKVPVFSFSASQNTSLALITAYQDKMDRGRIIDINDDGSLLTTSTPSLAIRNGAASTELYNWWRAMTSYPITASLSTRGLIKPSILCDYIRINVLFFGQKYNYSGLYMVTGQKDTINAQGYRTDLTLTRVKGDNV
jgi:hypothetical protein